MMAAVLAKGTTVIENAAREPEIVALTNFLMKMGAHIEGAGTTRLEIEGVDALHPVDEEMIPDRIEAATFLIAGALTGGTIRVERCRPAHITAVISKLQEAGAAVTTGDNWVSIKAPRSLKPVDVTTAVFPGFPTDVQAQWMVLMSVARGTSVITDTIYFDRFKHVAELVRLGADIEMNNNVATVRGVKSLTGAKVMSTDLRASASLVLAGLVAEGKTEVLRVYHLDRGYEAIEKKLRALGAKIERVSGQEF
jgi:UDP-N-acetylglucosamine 1-carboxyvinyltransferase